MTCELSGVLPWATALRDCWPGTASHDAVTMAYWRCFGRLDDDVFLCSYQKSGRTWLRFMLTYYQLRLFDVDYHLTMRNFPPLSPNVTLIGVFRLRDLPVDAPIHRILATHSEVPGLFRGLPTIMLWRDIRDVLVSYYYHRVARGELRCDLESFVWSSWGLPHVIRYHNWWLRALKRFPDGTVLELTYERLQADTAGTVGDCLQFMGLEVRDQLVNEAIDYASASHMRKLEARWGSPDFTAEHLRRDVNAFHVRKARVGGYSEELSADTIARIDAILGKELGDSGTYDY